VVSSLRAVQVISFLASGGPLRPKICCLSEDVKSSDNETLVQSTIYLNAACVIAVECQSGFALECGVLWRKKLEKAVGVDIWSYSICRFKCVREICKIRARIRWREQINPQRQEQV
jgi:hypothetical protein